MENSLQNILQLRSSVKKWIFNQTKIQLSIDEIKIYYTIKYIKTLNT